jgi:hypothetical protein
MARSLWGEKPSAYDRVLWGMPEPQWQGTSCQKAVAELWQQFLFSSTWQALAVEIGLAGLTGFGMFLFCGFLCSARAHSRRILLFPSPPRQCWTVGRWYLDSDGSLLAKLAVQELCHFVVYTEVVMLCILGLLTGLLMTFMLSRNLRTRFAGAIDGLCIPPMNISINATNVVPLGEYDHARATELLPWIGSFSYYWSKTTAQRYTAKGPIVDPLSQVKYSRLDYCLLKDDNLCSSDFNQTHVVTANLTGPQLGLWSGGEYNITYYIKLFFKYY